MKSFKFYLGILATALLLAGCSGKDEDVKDTTPAQLKSFALLAADNSSLLKEDVAVSSVSEKMVIRVPGGGTGKTFVATLTAGTNDVIKVNDKAVPATGKISVDATYPVDIVVTNSKSNLSAAYEVKIGKVLETVITHIATYTESGAEMKTSSFKLAVNPVTKQPYILYSSKKTGDSYNNLSVIKWNGTSFDAVGSLGLAGTVTANANLMAMAMKADGTPYVLYKGGTNGSSIMCMRKFNGTAWETVGGDAINTNNITNSYGDPEIYFTAAGQPAFFTTNNNKKATDGSYRNLVGYQCEGSSWTSTVSQLNIPVFGAKGSSDGFFYRACMVEANGTWYAVTSSNQYGHYVFKLVNGTWTKIVDNFVPANETFGIPTNLKAVANASGEVFIIASLSAQAKIQVYKLDEAKGTLVPYAGLINATAGSFGSIKENMTIGLNPLSGEITGVMDSPEAKPLFSVIGSDAQWTGFTAASDLVSASGYAIEYASDGTGYMVMINETSGIELFKIGTEDDVLPE